MKNPTYVHRNPYIVREHAKKVYDFLVEHNREEMVIRKEFEGLISPYNNSDPYPLNRIGNFGRVCARYQDNWVNKPLLIERLKRTPLHDIFEDRYFYEESQLRMIKEVLFRIGAESYITEQEWSSKNSCQQIDSVIEEGTGLTVLANELLALTVKDKLEELFTNPYGTIRIIDIGTGTGNTVIPIIETIDKLPNSQNYKDRLEVILVDGQQQALDIAYKRLKKKHPDYRDNFRSPIKDVKKVRENFANLHRNPIINRNQSADLIFSGAAIIHAPYKRGLFSLKQSILKEKGMLAMWDFYFKTFLAPSLRYGKYIGREIRIINRDTLKTEVYHLDEDEPFTEEINQKMKGNFVEIIGLLPEKELTISLENKLSWQYLFGYKGKEREQLAQRLREEHWKKVNTLQGFNFIEDFLVDLIDIRPQHQSLFSYIESYGDNIEQILREEGLPNAQSKSLDQLCKEMDKKSDLTSAKKESIIFTHASKQDSF